MLTYIAGNRITSFFFLSLHILVFFYFSLHWKNEHQTARNRDKETGDVERQMIVTGDIRNPTYVSEMVSYDVRFMILDELTSQGRSNQIGNSLHQQQETVSVRKSVQCYQLDQNNTCERIVGRNEQTKKSRYEGKTLKMFKGY